MSEQPKLRKIALMYRLYGKAEGRRCGECCCFVSGRYYNRILRKCKAYGMTHSAASDWAKSWDACGHFGKEPMGRPVIEIKRQIQAEKVTMEPLEGQMGMEEI